MQITIRPTLKQHLVNQALLNKEVDTIFFGGGAGGGKSWEICESRLINAVLHPGYKSFIGREELKRLMQSTYVTWTKVCKHHNIPEGTWKLNGQYNYIEFTNGSRIDLLDLKFLPTDPLYERLGSLEYTDGAIEEAGEIHFLAYDVLKSRIGRHMNKELGIRPSMLITGNPKKNWTYLEFYKPFRNGTLPKNIIFIQSLYRDNPYTAEEYEKQLSQIKDKSTRERLKEGNWEYDVDDNTLINYDAITDLFSNSVQDNGDKYLVIDVARQGQDKTIFHFWEGYRLYKRLEFSHQGIDKTAEELRQQAFEHHIAYSRILVDEDGVGGGVVDIARGVKGFIANTVPFDDPVLHKPANFQNLKTQCAYKLAEKVNNHSLAVRVDGILIKEKIIEELEQIKSKDKDKDGKLKIIPKDEVKEIIGRSPDDGDCLIMRMWFEFKEANQGKLAHTYIPQDLVRAPQSSLEKRVYTHIPNNLKR